MNVRNARPAHRWIRSSLALLLAVLVVGTAAPRMTAASSGASAPGPSGADLPGAAAPTAPQLPNFTAKGAALIRLQVGAFDPLAGKAPSRPEITLRDEAALPAGVAQSWLVQVESQRFPAAQASIARAGGILLGHIPDDTYMVKATPSQAEAIRTSPAVRWVGYYQPAWRIPTARGGWASPLGVDGTRTFRVHGFRADPASAAVGRALRGMAGVQVVQDVGVVIDVRTTAARLGAIAAIPGVQWVDVAPSYSLLNANARWVNDTGVRDLQSVITPTRLTGEGQTAAVADTAINYTFDMNGRAHVAFRDCNGAVTTCKLADYTQTEPGNTAAQLNGVTDNNTGHRKVAAFFDIAASGPNPGDDAGHGSHVAGSVTGDQASNGVWDGHDGLAPAARLVHQNIGTATGGLVLPGDLYDLFRQAYRPRNPAAVTEGSSADGNPDDYTTKYIPTEDARTHNNSWSSTLVAAPNSALSVIVDEFVWDHEDMTIVFSAGNGGPALNTFSAPSNAKNDISSGAGANGRQPMVSIDSMAIFSSHGPTADGRFGPDVVTPGQIVQSVKGGTTDGYHYLQGTSMSGPVLTGIATLVRQYFYDGYARAGGDGFAAGAPGVVRRHNPSAALVKATLINGAARMRGWYTGDDGTNRSQDGKWPSSGQGFGRVTLEDSLFFTGDPTNNFFVDVYRGDTADPDPNRRPFPLSPVPATRTFTVDVAPGAPLDVTLAWTDAPDLIPAGSPALVNNLDLTVTGPGGTQYVGNNFNSEANPAVQTAETAPGAAPPDVREVVERVRVANPPAGTYTITVRAAPISVGNQGFALAASGNISPAGGPAFSPGSPLQVDLAGDPAISNVRVQTFTRDTAILRFDTEEPTTATATIDLDGPGGNAPFTFVDSYNVGNDPPNVGPGPGLPGLNEGQVETSAEYANKPVLGRKHEIILTGLPAGQTVNAALAVRDIAGNDTARQTQVTTPANVFGADAPDIGQLTSSTAAAGWKTGTQLYAGTSGTQRFIGAFMFRIPQAAIDPSEITGGVVELTSAHNVVSTYVNDPILGVDLLDQSVEPNWGTQDYNTINGAPADAELNPQTTFKLGARQTYAFSLKCDQIEALKTTLATVAGGQRKAAFRWESTGLGLFSHDFGFNRRSGGPQIRPRLVLFTEDTADPYGAPCDPSAPAPTISEIGIHPAEDDDDVTVSWRTDVPSDSIVLFREQGQSAWTQVVSLAPTTTHQVEVEGLNPSKEYEFAVRSRSCNGATTTNTNGGAGYDFFRPAVEMGPPTQVAFYDFEAGTEGWTEETEDFQNPDQPADTEWTHSTPGASNTQNPDGSRSEDASKHAWHAKPYHDQNRAFLISPPLNLPGTVGRVAFFENHDLESPPEDAFLTNDALKVEISADGVNWQLLDFYKFQSPNYPNFVPRAVVFEDLGAGMRVRFTLESDDNVSTPPFEGASVDKVRIQSFDVALPEDLPRNGPVPPPSAEASGLTPPKTRVGPASAADIAAGTGACDVPARADLQVVKTDSPDPATVGQNLTYTVKVTNLGPDRAATVAVVDTLPAGVQFVSATATQGSCTGTSQVQCNLGDVGDAKTVTVTITVKPQDEGTLSNTAVVSSGALDPNSANDSDTEQTQVNPAAPPTCPRFEGTAGNHVVGTEGQDTLNGTPGRDIMCGLGGDDRLNGLDGNDVLVGGGGNDFADGGVGVDRIFGDSGNDELRGGDNADFVKGGTGNDLMRGGTGLDTLIGNKGSDDLFGDAGDDLLRGQDNRVANDDLNGGTDRDTCKADRGDTKVSCELAG